MAGEKIVYGYLIFLTVMLVAVMVFTGYSFQKKKVLEICSVDIMEIGEKVAIDKGLSSADSINPQQVQNFATETVDRLKSILSRPEKFGCDIIVWKGTVLSESRDITEEVYKQVKDGK